MKKALALLLASAMVVGLMGCTSEETTKKKKKTKKTTKETETTEDPTDDPTDFTTDDPTEPSSDPTSDPTSDTSTSDSSSATDTTAAPVVPGELVISHDLEKILLTEASTYRAYGASDMSVNYDKYGSVELDITLFSTADDYPELKDTLEEMYSQDDIDFLTSSYGEVLSLFKESASAGSEISDSWIRYGGEPVRADSQVVSLKVIVDIHIDGQEDLQDYYCLNIHPDTGMEFELDELILDVPGLTDYVYDALNRDPYVEHDIDWIINRIKTGKAHFTLTYDGIIVDGVKLPVAGHEALFNMEYFGATPKEYMLQLDSDHGLTWDFDGDGSLDTLACGYDYSTGTLTVSLNNDSTVFTDNEAPGIDGMDDFAYFHPGYVMCTEDGSFLFLPFNESDPVIRTYIFKIEEDGLSYVEDHYGYIMNGQTDPLDFDFVEYVDYLYGLKMNRPYTLGSDGKMMNQTAFLYAKAGPFEVLSDLEGIEFDWNSGESLGEYTIASGTMVSIWSCSLTNNSLVLLVLGQEEDLTGYHYVMIDTDSDMIIGGKDIRDVFGEQLNVGG